jgi:lipopolysaccharide export system protein LptC
MTWNFNLIAIAGALLLLALLTWWLPAALVERELPAAPRAHEPDYSIEQFTATSLNEAGRPRYKLSAARLDHYPDDLTTHLRAPRLIQYGEGTPVHTTANEGWISPDGKTIRFQGQVRVSRGRDPSTRDEATANEMLVQLE